MSSDLFSSEVNEDKHGFLMMAMNVHCHLSINIGDPNGHDTATFSLPPNQQGLKEAENMINALKAWIEQSKEVCK